METSDPERGESEGLEDQFDVSTVGILIDYLVSKSLSPTFL
jgi:hypothetical protein